MLLHFIWVGSLIPDAVLEKVYRKIKAIEYLTNASIKTKVNANLWVTSEFVEKTNLKTIKFLSTAEFNIKSIDIKIMDIELLFHTNQFSNNKDLKELKNKSKKSNENKESFMKSKIKIFKNFSFSF